MIKDYFGTKRLFFHSRLLLLHILLSAISSYSCILPMLKINQLNSLTFVKYIYIYENDLYTIRELLMSYGRKDRKTITIVGHEIIISNCV